VVVGVDEVVEDPEPGDVLTFGVAQEREGDAELVGEGGEGLLLVIRQGVERDPGLLERVSVLLQLDQLRAARRSPDRRPVHDHGGGSAGPVPVDVDDPAVLVARDDGRERLPDIDPGREPPEGV